MNSVSINERRTFVKKTMTALLAVGSGGLLYSVVSFFSPGKVRVKSGRNYAGVFDPETYRARHKENAFSAIKTVDGNYEIDLADLPEGESAIVTLSGTPVIAVNRGDNYRVYNATCTHLGCMVKWDDKSKRFLCPCHGGIYDENGHVIEGPPPAPIREYTTALSDNRVKVMIA